MSTAVVYYLSHFQPGATRNGTCSRNDVKVIHLIFFFGFESLETGARCPRESRHTLTASISLSAAYRPFRCKCERTRRVIHHFMRTFNFRSGRNQWVAIRYEQAQSVSAGKI